MQILEFVVYKIIENTSSVQQDTAGLSSQSNRDAAKCALMLLVGPVKAVNARKTVKTTALTGSPYKNLLETKAVIEQRQNKDGSD